MGIEAAAIRINPETKALRPGVPSNVIFPEFNKKPILTIITKDNVPAQIIEFPQVIKQDTGPVVKPEKSILEEVKKSENYHPEKRKKDATLDLRRLLRPRRRSRCDGVHDAEEKPCGSPRCRTKGRKKSVNDNRLPGQETKRQNRRTALAEAKG